MQLETVAHLSNAALLYDLALLISDNVKYDNNNLKIDSKTRKSVKSSNTIMHVPLMQLHQTTSMPMLVLTTSKMRVIFELLHPYSSIF